MSPTARGERTREAIRAAATELFLRSGYADTGVRDIAALADVDPALVIRHFGSKEELFVEVMESTRDETIRFGGDVGMLGDRIVRFILTADDNTRQTYLALVRAGGSQRLGSALRRMHEAGFVRPLAKVIGGDDADVRARLAAAMIGGLMYALWSVGDETLAAADVDDLAVRYAPLLQAILDG